MEEGWACPEKNFGFARGKLVVSKPEDVVAQHFDPAYAEGWIRGYRDAVAGISTVDSTPAWDEAVKTGAVRS